MSKEDSLLVAHVTHQAVRAHIKRGGVGILITGSTECHGDHLPEGTDTFIAQAVALEVARQCDGLVFPPFWFSYSGGTRPFPGTVTMPSHTQIAYTRAVIDKLVCDGYRHLLHLQWHGPYYANQQLTREIFEETGVPLAYFGLMTLPIMSSEEIVKLIGRDPFTRETTVAAGALSLLGLPHLLKSEGLADEQPAKRPEDACLAAIGKVGGIVGHCYTDSTQHLAVRTKVDAEAGRQVIFALAREISSTVESLREYCTILDKRKATGRASQKQK